VTFRTEFSGYSVSLSLVFDAAADADERIGCFCLDVFVCLLDVFVYVSCLWKMDMRVNQNQLRTVYQL